MTEDEGGKTREEEREVRGGEKGDERRESRNEPAHSLARFYIEFGVRQCKGMATERFS